MVLKVYRFQKRAFLLTKTKKMVFSNEDLVLIKVLRQEKGFNNW